MMLFAAHYEMPFDVVRDDIHKSVKETVKQLRKRFAERPDLKGLLLSSYFLTYAIQSQQFSKPSLVTYLQLVVSVRS